MHKKEHVDQYNIERCKGNEDNEDCSMNELTKPWAYGPITYWTMDRGEESTRSDPETMRGREWAKAKRKSDKGQLRSRCLRSEVKIPEC